MAGRQGNEGGRKKQGNESFKADPTEPFKHLSPSVGRPTLYDPSYCEEVVNVMRAGFSLSAFAGIIGVSRDTITEWQNRHPEFSAAVSRGKMARTVHWEEAGIKTAMGAGGPGSATMIQFALRNIDPHEYPDKQKQEVSGPDGGPVRIQSIRRRIVDPAAEGEE